MKERPIILSGESVRAIQAGRKTHTRRVILPQPDEFVTGLTPRTTYAGNVLWSNVLGTGKWAELDDRRCPFEQPGDRLWAKEALYENAEGVWCYRADDEWVGCDMENEGQMMSWVFHKNTRYCSPLFMPRWASRLTLQITSIAASRLQSITDEEALLEGVWRPGDMVHADMKGQYGVTDYTPRNQYMHTWEALNFARGYGWNSNPWVWDIAFRVVEP